MISWLLIVTSLSGIFAIVTRRVRPKVAGGRSGAKTTGRQ